jgi:hypothetical protein
MIADDSGKRIRRLDLTGRRVSVGLRGTCGGPPTPAGGQAPAADSAAAVVDSGPRRQPGGRA